MFNLRSTMLVAGAVFASFSGLVVAETTDQMEEEVITVIGTRTERSLNEVATSVSVISAVDIEEGLIVISPTWSSTNQVFRWREPGLVLAYPDSSLEVSVVIVFKP